MTMKEKFPDDSARIREERKIARKGHNFAFFGKNDRADTNQALADYYVAEFRTWHFQVGLYITMGVVAIYFCVFTALSYFQ
jgi:hypothetical protein